MLNISVFICLSLMVYCFFVLNQDYLFYKKFMSTASILNTIVSDVYQDKQKSLTFGQSSLPWFVEEIMKKCKFNSSLEMYVNLEYCLKPFCSKKTIVYNQIIKEIKNGKSVF